jgi:hypothetical protein
MGVWLRDWGHYDYVFAGGSEGGDYVLPAHAAVAIAIAGANVVVTALVARRERSTPWRRRRRTVVGAA